MYTIIHYLHVKYCNSRLGYRTIALNNNKNLSKNASNRKQVKAEIIAQCRRTKSRSEQRVRERRRFGLVNCLQLSARISLMPSVTYLSKSTVPVTKAATGTVQ